MGSRPRSPSASPADRWGPQPGGPGPAKRRRMEEPAGHEFEEASDPDNVTGAPATGALTSLVVLADGCALHVPLDDVDLLLEPEPTSVRQVSLGDRILMLVPEALLGSGVEGPWGQGLGRGAFLSAPGEYMALEPGFLCPAVPDIACQEEVNEEEADADADFLPAGTDAAAISVAGLRPSAGCMSGFDLLGLVSEPSPRARNTSPERGSPHHDDNLDLHLPEPFPDSPLQPLPPSPSPGPHERPQRPHGPPRKARRCLFPESTASHNSWPTERAAGESLLILAVCALHTP
ncbi:proline-rich protein 23C-like [Balaenoptera ricei]|uniref:proline-rich protein 23C-like n=1 Tax=Balaenoptera ricei TaxID=2746895 RepID=UPI0028BD82C7|nr:proline-rich protein 23C-like [Balaenoptera ricei]